MKMVSVTLPRPVSFELRTRAGETLASAYARFTFHGLPMIVAAWKMGINGCHVVSDTHRLDFKWEFVG